MSEPKNEGFDLAQDLESDVKANADAVQLEAQKEAVAEAKAAAEAAAQAKAEAAATAPTITMRDETKKPFLSDNAKKEIREWVVAFAFALVAFFLIRTFLFTVITVDGKSMETTLHDGERLIVTVLDMKTTGPQHGDVVICHYPDRKENFVKRVIGLPGDIVSMENGITYVNTEPIDEPYIENPDMGSYGPYEVPDGQYFVLGDNRNASNDSRRVGFIDRKMFVGKVRFVMWPLTGLRVVH